MEFKVRGIFNFLCTVAAFFLIMPALCVFAQEEKTTIRVGLSNQSFSTFEHSSAKFSSPDELLVVDMASNGNIKVQSNEIITVEIKDSKFFLTSAKGVLLEDATGPVVLTPQIKIGIEDLNRKGYPAYYSGLIELIPVKADKFNIINVLDIQTYLKGVVPNEMPVSFGLEALKAQAIAARNYANRPQNAYKNYDICDSTACQVYYGMNSQKEISDKAVDETKGIFALYTGEPILALYSSTAGGITEDWKNVYAYNQPQALDKPYLKSVVDDKKQKFLTSEKDVREYYSNKALSYDIKSPRYRWSYEWDTPELEAVLNKTLLEQSRAGLVEPQFDGSYVLEGLKDIKILARGNSGKALEIEIVFKNGTYKVRRELGIRRVLKKNNAMLPSGNFFVDKEGKLEIASDDNDSVQEENGDEKQEKKEAQGDKTKEESKHVIFAFEKLISPILPLSGDTPTKFIITGGGFGHGVGMSQYGAGYMAQNGKTYDDILKHYYSGIHLGTMKKEVLHNPYSIEYKTEFYYYKASKKKCILKVTNSKKISKLAFKINSTEFNPDMTGYSAKTLGMDITKYLVEGSNTIVFLPLDSKDKGKSVKFQIEIGN